MRWIVGSFITGVGLVLMFIGACLEWTAWHLAYIGEWIVE